jgi:hypothetical protein
MLWSVLALPVGTCQAAADDKPDLAERRLAVNLIRAINTAEMAYRGRQGKGLCGGWKDISVIPEFTTLWDRLSRRDARLKNANLFSPDELLPSWRLRLMVSEDGKSFVVTLINTKDECSPAFSSDEEGPIREGATIGCSASCNVHK